MTLPQDQIYLRKFESLTVVVGIIIPIYNEKKVLTANSLHFRSLSRQAELIFVDGASVDKSASVALALGRVLLSQKGRALQMNYGAGFAQGELLLFLHADTVISILGLIPGVVISAFFGGRLGEIRSFQDLLAPKFLTAAGLMVLIIAVPFLYQKFKNSSLKKI